MKQFKLLFIFSLVLGISLALPKKGFSQCPNNNIYWVDLTPTGVGNTQTTSVMYAGEYVTVTVCQGASYTFSACANFYDTQLTLYSSTGTFLAYNDDGCGLQSIITWTATFSGVVWVLLDQFNCVSNSIFSSLSVTQNTACAGGGGIPNDLCSNAIAISCGQTLSGTTTGATATGQGPDCVTTVTAPGVWYTITGTGGNITLTLCNAGTNYDTKLHVYTGSCGSFTCVTGNDDDGGCFFSPLYSTVQFPSVSGVTYYIYVSGFSAATGNFQLSALCTGAPVNDLCSGAIALTCPSNITGSTTNATTNGAPPTCNGFTVTAPGLWYTILGNGATVEVSTCNAGTNFDTKLHVYTGSCGSFTCVTANDDAPGCGLQSTVTFPTTNGVTYYIYVSGFSSTTGNFQLSVSCLGGGGPAPGCPDINAGNDVNLGCGQCTTLSSTFLAVGATTSYGVSSIPFTPPYPFNSGNPILVNVDDIWSGVINLPFNFCYFGNTYNQLVAGSNGVVSFNTTYANGYCPWAFTDNNPSPNLPLNSIFGPYHDIDPSVGGAMYSAVLGTAPCRTYVVNWNLVPMYSASCNAMLATHQIVLYETTNVIEVYIQNKPLCSTWNSGHAIVGIQNATGTVGYTAPNRNTTPTWTASNEAWRFTPNGPNQYSVAWYEGSNLVSNNPSFLACPLQTTTYTAQITYQNCGGGTTVLTDDVVVTIPSLTLSLASQNPSCPIPCNGAIAVTGVAGGVGPFNYVWGHTGANVATVTGLCSGTYSVTVTDAQGCGKSETITLGPPPIYNINGVATPDNCNGIPDGTITISGSVGSGPFQFAWSNGATVQNPSGLAAGNYTVTVTNGAGCQIISPPINVPNEPPSGPAGIWTWIGIINVNWFEPCNWDKKSVPTINDPVVIPGGTPWQPLIQGGTGQCFTLDLNSDNGGTLIVDGPNGGALTVQQ